MIRWLIFDLIIYTIWFGVIGISTDWKHGAIEHALMACGAMMMTSSLIRIITAS